MELCLGANATCPGANATCPICKKSDCSCLKDLQASLRSASDHGVDGALETRNEHLPHVPQRVHNNSRRCCALDGLTSYGRRAVCGIQKETNWAAIVKEVLGKPPRWISEGRRTGEDGLAARPLLLLH
ncbi:hypothetical protein LINGRAHAP2_LOCUS32021 [Linum grandiflorum]